MPTDLPNSRLGQVDLAVQAAQGDIVTLQTDLGTLQTDVGTLQTDLGTLQTDYGNTTTDLSDLYQFVEGNQAQHNVMVPLATVGVHPGLGAYYVPSTGHVLMELDNQVVTLPIDHLLRDGTIITNVRGWIDPGTNTAAGLAAMTITVGYTGYDPVTHAVTTNTAIAVAIAATLSGAIQTITDGSPGNHTVARANRSYWVQIKATNSATASTDTVGGVAVVLADAPVT